MKLRLALLVVLGLASVATLPALAQTGSDTGAPTSTPAGVQNQVVAAEDGTLYLIRNGQRHVIMPATLPGAELEAIPLGDTYADGVVPTDAAAPLFAGGALGSGTAGNPPGNAAAAPPITAATATPMPTAAATLPSSVGVALNEWSISPDATTLTAGKVSFAAQNGGKGLHEMVIFKSDKDPGSLPVSKSRVDESAVGDKIGEIEDLKPGSSKSATFNLSPGKYLLICNLANHYAKGMISQFEVK
jgi:uncharacterized cupredoxin-like copper-binding protein